MRLRLFILCFNRTAISIQKIDSKSSKSHLKSLPRISPKSYRHNAVSNHFSSHFSTSHTNAPRSLSRVKVGTHSAFAQKIAHNGLHAETGAFRTGVVSLPSDRSARSQTSPGRVSERQTLPLLGLGWGHSRRTQRAFGTAMRMMRVAVPRRRGPAGLRDPVSALLSMW